MAILTILDAIFEMQRSDICYKDPELHLFEKAIQPYILRFFYLKIFIWSFQINPLSANPTKWSNTQTIRRQIAWVCLTILWNWRLKG